MNYKINKVWVVVIDNPKGQTVCTYTTRTVAMEMFNKIIKLLNETFPNDCIVAYNLKGTKGNAYYNLLNNHYTVTLTGSHLSYYTNVEESELKKIIKGEK